MSNHINTILILCLGIAIGVIVMLLRERDEEKAATTLPGISEVNRASPSVLSTQATRPPQSTPPPSQPAPPAVGVNQEPTEEGTTPIKAEMSRVLGGEASEEEQLAFWQGIQTSKRLDALINELQTATKADSDDIAGRLSLGQAYVAKLWGSPAGPAQGLWASKAEGVWDEILEIDPENWDAQRNIAFSYSQYPDFVNKTGDAIAAYEKTLAIQENAPDTKGRFASSYRELAKLHVKNGDPSSALATLEKGTAVHPDDASLAEQLKTISSSYKFEDEPGQ